MTVEEFVAHYRVELEALLGREPQPEEGYGQEELDRAQAQLGLGIPRVLRGVYALCGKTAGIHDAFNRLLSPGELHVADDGALVFFEENQEVVTWAIRPEALGEEDPAVVQIQEEDAWYADTPALSTFLLKQLYWNLVNGALPYCGEARASSEALSQLKEQWRCAVSDEDVTVLRHDDCVVCLVGAPQAPMVVAGARSEAGKARLARAGLDLE